METVNFEDLDVEVRELIIASTKARSGAYAPYSKFKVGAAIRCEDGTIYVGSNVENASYGLTICAERTAAVKAVSDGRTKFKYAAVCATLNGDFVAPCGACRQFLAEFAMPTMNVYLTQLEPKKVLVTSIDELLPLCFLGTKLLSGQNKN